MAALPDGSPVGTTLSRRVLRFAVPLVLAVALLAGLDRLADFGARRFALSEVSDAAAAAVGLRVAVLRSEIEKQRTLPIVLERDADVRAALAPGGPAAIAALNAKLEALAAGTRAGAIYVLDLQGKAIAASNYRTPTSFVGSDYSFRPYFRRAMAEGQAEHFAFGTVSRRPGLYLTRRLDGPSGPLGVLVVKTEFEAIEAEWRRLAEPTFVTDDRSIVVVTSEPDWRFRTTAAIPDDQRAAIRESLQFGDAALEPLPIGTASAALGTVSARLPASRSSQDFIEASADMPTVGWHLHVLAPTEATVRLATTAARTVAMLAGLIGLGIVAALVSRWNRSARERKRQAEARRELEARVADRTAELSDANGKLLDEIDERRRAQAALHDLQDELVQASRLAVLGQIAASVAHEVNQPVAAIRTFAENSAALITRGDVDAAQGNLAIIAGLTDRIGTITGEMRAFARKTPGRIEPVSLNAVVDGALLLLGHRLKQQAIELSVALPEGEVKVAAERVRLEQVFVNLLQNAIEALSNRPDGRIDIRASATPERVSVSIADNGSGLPPAVMAALFMPFTTTKSSGLGLGLVISNDIMAEFGGTLTVENRDGAVFTLTLPRTS